MQTQVIGALLSVSLIGGVVLIGGTGSSLAVDFAQRGSDDLTLISEPLADSAVLEVSVSGTGAALLLPKYHLPGYRLSQTGEDNTGSQQPVLFGSVQSVGLTYRFGEFQPPLIWGKDARILLSIQHAQAFGRLATRQRSPPGLFHAVTVDGRVGFHQPSIDVFRSRRWYFSHRRLEIDIRLATDFDTEIGVRVSPALFLLGGISRDLYQHRFHSLDINGTSFIGLPYSLDQAILSMRFGTGAGLSAVVPLRSGLALTVSGDLAVYWIGTRLRSSDCVRGVAGTNCGLPSGTFQPGVAYATNSSDTAATVGFRTKVTLGLTQKYSWGTVHLSGFFAWDSAVPGIENPASPSSAVLGSFVGKSRVKYDPSWSAGATVGLSVPLN